jgi:cytochrome oxidase Cu insertion factor (SCO1/SenC/PrrC family)
MTELRQSPQRTIWVGFGFVTGLLGLALLISFLQINRSRHLPLLRVIGPVADFTLTNQDGQITTLADFTNHVWVADIIFTRCAGPCPRLTGQMHSLHNLLPADSAAKLVTLTTDPEFDTPAVLKKYGQRFNADFSRWTFLTGTKGEIAALASGSLKLSAVPVKLEDQKSVADLFIHTTIFVIVDKHSRLRGFFETGGDGVDWTNSVQPKLMQSVRQLELEP